MSVFKKLMISAAALFAAVVSTSCTDEAVYPAHKDTVSPRKAPAVFAWSGYHGFEEGATRSGMTRSGGSSLTQNSNYFKICDFGGKSDWMRDNYPTLYECFDNAPATTDRGEFVSQHEYDVVMEYLRAHPNEGSLECDLTTYFIQNVGSGHDEYTVDYVSEDGSVHHSQSVKGFEKMNFLTLDGAHVPDFNATDGKRALIVDVPASDPTYADSYGDLDQTKHDAYRFYYIEVDGVINCYLCFDWKTRKYDNGMCDYPGDGDYTDWVIKLVPADGSQVTLPGNNGGNGEVNPDDGDDSGNGSGSNPTPSVPEGVTSLDEVEINLSLNDSHEYDGESLTTKLSIHVRSATDVEVFIPVPARYYCEADDLDIVISHREELLVYGEKSVAVYEILPGHTVTLTVTFEQDGIRVTTDGIDEEIISYCFENYGDGLNFEIWNYFNDPEKTAALPNGALSRDELQYLLNQATVRFLDGNPDYYINAYNDTDGGSRFEGDCRVGIVDEQRGQYGNPTVGEHYNGSPYNEIYANLNDE